MKTDQNPETTSQEIIEQALFLGASVAGIARTADLSGSGSYQRYQENPYYPHFTSLPHWPDEARSVLVFGVKHPGSEPEMDWWDTLPGGTPGNRILIQIQKQLGRWLQTEIGVQAQPLAYQIEKGGVFLKDAAVLAGIGIIGKNNLFLTPDYGPQIRLRAMFLPLDLAPGNPMEFDPCAACDMPCFKACPQDAFRNGSYQREYCQVQMRIDEAHPFTPESQPEVEQIHYCRSCELACPAAG